MDLSKLTYGNLEDGVANVVIEISRGSINKYEFEKDTGLLTLDRVNGTALGYPADYGFIPHTLCDDGDPLDALLIIYESVPAGIVVPCRPIGVLYFEDDGEMDEKLICVAFDDVSKNHIHTVDDLGETFKKNIEHFYRHYKDWKHDWKGVSAELKGWGGPEEALKVFAESVKRAQK